MLTLTPAQLWPTGGAPSFRDFVADVAGVVVACAAIVARAGGAARFLAASRAAPTLASAAPADVEMQAL